MTLIHSFHHHLHLHLLFLIIIIIIIIIILFPGHRGGARFCVCHQRLPCHPQL